MRRRHPPPGGRRVEDAAHAGQFVPGRTGALRKHVAALKARGLELYGVHVPARFGLAAVQAVAEHDLPRGLVEAEHAVVPPGFEQVLARLPELRFALFHEREAHGGEILRVDGEPLPGTAVRTAEIGSFRRRGRDAPHEHFVARCRARGFGKCDARSPLALRHGHGIIRIGGRAEDGPVFFSRLSRTDGDPVARPGAEIGAERFSPVRHALPHARPRLHLAGAHAARQHAAEPGRDVVFVLHGAAAEVKRLLHAVRRAGCVRRVKPERHETAAQKAARLVLFHAQRAPFVAVEILPREPREREVAPEGRAAFRRRLKIQLRAAFERMRKAEREPFAGRAAGREERGKAAVNARLARHVAQSAAAHHIRVRQAVRRAAQRPARFERNVVRPDARTRGHVERALSLERQHARGGALFGADAQQFEVFEFVHLARRVHVVVKRVEQPRERLQRGDAGVGGVEVRPLRGQRRDARARALKDGFIIVAVEARYLQHKSPPGHFP